uniref:Uncharacterized protein n=1 Tax=Salix viminalis TaxID=40686 RepID=A0A6N2KFX1_SALVM
MATGLCHVNQENFRNPYLSKPLFPDLSAVFFLSFSLFFDSGQKNNQEITRTRFCRYQPAEELEGTN